MAVMQVQKTVFISYRRTNIYMARAVYGNLRANGYDAFLDYQSLDSGDFSQSLLNQIAARAHFVVILTPSALERCTNPDDWMRKEIEYAIQQKRNVIPLMFEGFDFNAINHYLVSDWLKMLPSYNGLRIPEDFFEEAMDRLRGSRYLDRDIDTVLHPVAAQAAKAAEAAQIKADSEPAPTTEQLEAERLFESGYRKSRLMSDYIGAIEDFDRVIKLRPNDADGYHWRGRAKLSKGDKKAALKDLKKALSLKPDGQHVNIIRSVIAYEEGNLALALTEAQEAVNYNPNYDEAYFRRGYTLESAGDFEGAIADYTEAIRLNPNFVYAYNNRGWTYYNKDDMDNAITDFNKVIQLNPQDGYTYVSRGTVHWAKGNREKAIADFTEAIRISPNYAFAYSNRGWIKHNTGDIGGAIADYEAALRIDPYSKLANENLEKARRAKEKK
jgi:tetratricopeptide (TPR) repeat protein